MINYIIILLVAGTEVIGIKCEDEVGLGMVLASFSNGQVTDSSWKCSNTYFPGWSTPGFDASTWERAYEIAKNIDGAPWNHISGILNNAEYIWTRNWDRHGKDTVYCRKVVNPPPGQSYF